MLLITIDKNKKMKIKLILVNFKNFFRIKNKKKPEIVDKTM